MGPGGAASRRLCSKAHSSREAYFNIEAVDFAYRTSRLWLILHKSPARKRVYCENVVMPPLRAPSYGGGGRQGSQPLPLCILFYLRVSVVNFSLLFLLFLKPLFVDEDIHPLSYKKFNA